MADVVKKTTKTLTLKNPSSSSLSKIIKEKLDIDVNNLKGSDIPKLFKKGLRFKGLLGKKVIDSIGNYLKKNPSTKKQYEKFLPDNLKKIVKDKKIIKDKKKVNKLPVTTINKQKDKKINIGEILKNKKQNKNLITNSTKQNKNTGTNITKRVIEGEVIQGIKKPKNVGNVKTQTIDGKFKNITSKTNRIGSGQNKINTQGIKRRQFLAVDKDFPFKKKDAIGEDKIKKIKPPKDDFTPKIKKPYSPKVKKEELPKIKTPKKKIRSNIVQKGGKPTSSYDAQFTYDQLKKRGLKPKGFMSPENYAKVKKLKEGTKDKTIGKPKSLKSVMNKKIKDAEKKDSTFGMLKTSVDYPKLFDRVTKKSAGKTVGLKDLPPKSESPGIHKLPAKAKINMGFKPMFGGGLIASFYDKPEKTEKYKGNTTSARQVKGYGKAKKKA